MSRARTALMRNISQLVATLLLIASQVRAPVLPILGDVTAAVKAPAAEAAGHYEVKLNTNSASPVEVVPASKQPDYEAEVLKPLRDAQAQIAAKAEADAKARAERSAARRKLVSKVTTVAAQAAAVVIPSNDVWGSLRLCEAGGSYTRNSGNGYYGAYQYSLSSWGNYMGYARPDLAPPTVQDAKARETQSARGWSPWPSCARQLGLW